MAAPTEAERQSGEFEDNVEMEEEESESSSSDDSEADVDEKAIAELETRVSASPYQYELHVQLINLLRKEGELEKLHQARERMHQLFPLSEELWLQWLQDEIRIGSEDDREEITTLFERAIGDYMSVGVILEYVQYSIGGMGATDGISKVRDVFETAITTVGLHVTKGVAIWEAYREFESALLQTLQPGIGAIVTEDKQKEIDKQMKRVANLFKRQLSIPMMDMETTYQEFQEWSVEPVPDHIKIAYKKALDKLEKRKPFEESLLSAVPPRLQEYQSYIDYEKSDGDPARIQCIYERCLQENCLVPDLWKQYTKYLDSQLKIGGVSLAAHKRAVRNCPWSVYLWLDYLLALERYKEPHDKVKEAFEKAINSGISQATEYFQLWQSYIDSLRRRIDWQSEHKEELEDFRNTMRNAIDYLAEYFGDEADPTCTLQRFWATIEAKHCGNKPQARELWEEVMAGHSREAQMWLEYFNFERAYGDNKHCRKVLVKAVNSTSDWPELVCEALTNFERQEGSIEQYEAAVDRVENQMKKVNDRRTKAAEQEADRVREEQEKLDKKRQVKAEKKAFKKEDTKTIKQKVKDGNVIETSQEDSVFKVPLLPGMVEKSKEVPSLKRQREDDDDVSSKKLRTAIAHDASKDPRTVFVKNLSYDLKEERIRDLFSKCGQITEVRMVTNFKNKFKGFCYIEFQDEFAVKKALELDRQPVDGRPMYVDPSIDKTKTAAPQSFQWSTNMERNKLFVSGLPRSITKEKLSKFFGKHGTIKEVRLVTYRSGTPKGLAYVDYNNEEDASKAVLATDGSQMGEHKISVAISNPPVRKQKRGTTLEEDLLELPKGPMRGPGFGPRGKGRTQLAFMPRALKKPQTATQAASRVDDGDKQQHSRSSSDSQSSTAKKMSNADFAKLFF
ncbi:spliceosome associated factor 3, U4/U6 recycling protein-like [Glandiceps talaboti]